MKFSYEDLISGAPIFVDKIGHFRPPKLKELRPDGETPLWLYQVYLSILSGDKEHCLKIMKITTGRNLKKLEEAENITVFDALTILQQTRKLLQDAMAFFMLEIPVWDDKERCFLITSKEGEVIGKITRSNFDDVRDMMLQLNYINIGKSAEPIKHSSAKAKALWERVQKHLKEQSKKASPKDNNYKIGNIISKLCAANIGYTLFNIYELTIFQLYDQFFQYGYLRAMNLNEMAYSNHGGEKFDIQAWLKPILKF